MSIWRQFHSVPKRVRSPLDDVHSVTSGETTASDSGRGGSEDDSFLPPIAEVPPECGSTGRATTPPPSCPPPPPSISNPRHTALEHAPFRSADSEGQRATYTG
ncbi:hypothetical protein ACOMHN_058786 [Nucella lapillus]